MSALEQYRKFLAGLPAVDAGWFAKSFGDYRQERTDTAQREISGRYLPAVLAWVESRYPNLSEAELLDLVQDGNAGLIEAIKNFQGDTPAEFEAHYSREILEYLARITPTH